MIHWNSYNADQHTAVWQRLDALDQILVPMLPMANLAKVETFVLSKRVRLREDATKGRKLYHALKLCEKNRHFTDESGLGIHYKQVRPLWDEFERRVLALAKASYDFFTGGWDEPAPDSDAGRGRISPLFIKNHDS